MPDVKVFRGASTGNMRVDNPETLDGIFRDGPTPIITHCEDTPMIDALHAIAREKYCEDIQACRWCSSCCRLRCSACSKAS